MGTKLGHGRIDILEVGGEGGEGVITHMSLHLLGGHV